MREKGRERKRKGNVAIHFLNGTDSGICELL